MDYQSLLVKLDKQNIRLELNDGRLKCYAPKGGLTQELRLGMSKYKREIIEFLENVQASKQVVATIPQVDRSLPLPLSFSQQRLWFLDSFDGPSSVYNIPFAYSVHGALNIDSLKESFCRIVERHESLHTCFVEIEGDLRQVIEKDVEPEIEIRTIAESEVEKMIHQYALAPFELGKWPLIRLVILKLSDTEHVIVLNMHHIISDGWSISVFVKELLHFYSAIDQGNPPILPELPIQYADYAHWQRETLQGERLEKLTTWWKELLSNAPSLLNLPTDFVRPAMQNYEGDSVNFRISSRILEGIEQLSREQGTTLFVTLISTFQILLSKYCNTDDIVLGTPTANRFHKELEGLIGLFVNMLVLREKVDSEVTFPDFLAQVHRNTMSAYEHQELPFEQLVEAINPVRTLGYSPLFQVLFVLQNAPTEVVRVAELELSPIPLKLQSAKFDLSIYLTETEQGLIGSLEYNSDIFKQETVQRLLENYRELLRNIVDDPYRKIANLGILTAEEQKKLLTEWNETSEAFPKEKCLHQLFEEQVEKTPDKIAVEFENQRLSYAELNEQSNRLAAYLQGLGVEPEALVGIATSRSLEMIVALLAVLKAGCGYVPIDLNHPRERIEYILQDSGVSFLLMNRKEDEEIHPACEKIYFDLQAEIFSGMPIVNPSSNVSSKNIAYSIYTSGSTGKPKGVVIEHRSVVNFLNSMARSPGIGEEDRLLAVTTLSFDIAVLEIFLPLLNGASVVIADSASCSDGEALLAMMKNRGITIMQATPATWNLLVFSGWENPLPLKILSGGEALSADLAAKLARLCKELWNMYGPTETTIWSTLYKYQSGTSHHVPIGKPIENTQVYILDKNRRPVPIGAEGELYLGGYGLAREYLNRPDLTRQKFPPNPFSDRPGARLYRTGDRVKYSVDGNIEYLGRSDHQVKIRGFRIELEEIKAVLLSHDYIVDAVVTIHDFQSEDKRIVAYLVFKKTDGTRNEKETVDEIRELLKNTLPEYMIPAYFIELEDLPLTPNGKLDLKSLPAPLDSLRNQKEKYVSPKTELELEISKIWHNLLGIEKIGVHDNFFELGGHSILAVRLQRELRRITKFDITVVDIFRFPTIHGLLNHFLHKPDKATQVASINSRANKRRTYLTKRKKRDQ